jgi:hypothetical protein
MRANCLAEKERLHSRIRTASGSDRPETQPEIARMLNDTNHDPLNLAPVATAPGSDTRLKHFLSNAGGTT